MPEVSQIVVVSDEELFIEFMERFSPKTSQLHFASDLSEAAHHCRTLSPGLIVIRVDEESPELLELLNETSRFDVRVLGLSQTPQERQNQHIDRLAPIDDREAVFRAAARLLNERRRYPRVDSQLLVEVEGMGSLIATTASPVSLFVETASVLEVGTRVATRLHHGDGVVSGEATVARVGLGESGNMGMVLLFSEESTDLRSVLGQKVRETLHIDHKQPMQAAQQHQEPRPLQGLSRQIDQISRVIEGLEERAAMQQARIQELELQVQQLGGSGPADRGDSDQSERLDGLEGQLEQLQQQLKQEQKDQDKLLKHHDDQVLALGRGLEQVAELSSTMELSIKETGGQLRRLQEQTQESVQARLDELHGKIQEQESVQARLDELHGKITRAFGRLDELAADGGAQETMAEARSELDQRIGALGDRVDKLEALGTRVEGLEALGDRIAQVETVAGAAVTREAFEAGQETQIEQIDQLHQQVAQKLAQAQKETSVDLEQRLERERQLAQSSMNELTWRVDKLDKLSESENVQEALSALHSDLQDQLGELGSRLSRVETLAGEAATRESLEASRELLEQVRQQISQDLSQVQQKATEDLEQRQERERALQGGLSETSERLSELAKRMDELAGDSTRDAVADLQEKLEALTDQLAKVRTLADEAATREALEASQEALQQERQQTAQELEQTLTRRDEAMEARVELVAQQIATALKTFEEIRMEILDMLEALGGQVSELVEEAATKDDLDAIKHAAEPQMESLGRRLEKLEHGQIDLEDQLKRGTGVDQISTDLESINQRLEALDKLKEQLRSTDDRSQELSKRLDQERSEWEKRLDELTSVVQRLDKEPD